MNHKLKYFKKFLDDPASFPNREFYRKIRKWAKYVTDHKDEFNYLKDDEWKEIRERVLAELERREDIKEEFEELQEQLAAIGEIEAEEKINLYEKWLEFMRAYIFECEFTKEQIGAMEAKLEKLTRAVRKYRVIQEKLRISKIDTQKAVEDLADELFEYYERTGKRPVLTSINYGTRLKGN